MDASEFNRLLETDHYAPADLDQVTDLCRNYPMFGLAHMLRVRIMEALKYEKNDALRKAAVYAPDRQRLFTLVEEVKAKEVPVDTVPEAEAEEAFSFNEENSEEAEVIIGQHAPYAAPESDEPLLELDEEEEADELSSETLIEAVAKDDVEMEEADARNPEAGDVPASEDSSESRRLIRNFIQDSPGPIRADRETSLKGDVSKSSIKENDGFITDTLAQIYVKQRLYAKAIYAYEKLSLKYPEKSAYFAAQIEKIRNINHS